MIANAGISHEDHIAKFGKDAVKDPAPADPNPVDFETLFQSIINA